MSVELEPGVLLLLRLPCLPRCFELVWVPDELMLPESLAPVVVSDAPVLGEVPKAGPDASLAIPGVPLLGIAELGVPVVD